MTPEPAELPFELQELLAVREAQYAAAAARGQEASTMLERIAETTVSASSVRGEVRVTVAGSGLLREVAISQRGIDLGATALASLTLMTLRRALAGLQERIEAEAAEAGGIGAATAAEYRAGLAEPLSHLDDRLSRD